MCQLVVLMLKEHRVMIHSASPLVSGTVNPDRDFQLNEREMRLRLQEQMEVRPPTRSRTSGSRCRARWT